MDRSVESIFRVAIEKDDPAERQAFLDSACGDDFSLRVKVEAMLQDDDQTADVRPSQESRDVSDGFFNASGSRAGSPSEAPGDRIGAYKLLQPIGEGGFGTVWMAQQDEPVKRRVALKVIKLGMDTRQVIARFEAERQALAMMDHPNIAKVLDAGATETGRPYFAMELVRGVSIIEYCDTEKLDTTARLKLFIDVCHAIQHAHQKGIIHRDVKPSNVLVTLHDGVPVPKVIDFGIAKATNTELTNKTLFTEHRQLIGTPAYMSPEQAEMSGLDIDTRSDIYSLGVLLYELLTGVTPFDAKMLREAGYSEMMRIIREVEPYKPSSRLSSLGEVAYRKALDRHVSDPKKLGLLLRGDLDWIVMKCLEKDRTRRYESASGVAADIERYMRGEAVLAAPPSAVYRMRKFIRRNKVQVAVAMLVTSVLLLGVAGTSIGMVWALDEKARADLATERAIAAAEAEAEQRDLAEENFERMRKMLESADPSRSPGGATVLQLLDTASQDLDESPPENALAEALIREVLGNAYCQLGEYGKAQEHQIKALAIRENHTGRRDDPHVADALHNLAATLWWRGEYDQAERYYLRSLEMRQRLYPEDHAKIAASMTHLAACRLRMGRHNEAREMYENVLAMRRRLFGEESEEIAQALNNLAKCMLEAGEFHEAETLHRQALDMIRRVRGDDFIGTAAASHNLGICLLRRSEAEQVADNRNAAQASATGARAAFNRALQIRKETFPHGHHHIAASLNGLARADLLLGNVAAAAELAEQSVEEFRRTRRPDHPDLAEALETLGSVQAAQGRWADAIATYREALRIAQQTRPPAEVEIATLRGRLGLALANVDDAEAESLLLESLVQIQQLRGDTAVDTAIANQRLATFHIMRGNESRAEQYREAARLAVSE